jgi:hypothetical protein
MSAGDLESRLAVLATELSRIRDGWAWHGKSRAETMAALMAALAALAKKAEEVSRG